MPRRGEKCDSEECFKDANLKALEFYPQLIFTQLSAKDISIIPILQIRKPRIGYLTSPAQGHNIVNSAAGNTKALKFCSWFSTDHSFSLFVALRYVYIQTVQGDEQSRLGSLTQILNPEDHFYPLAHKISAAITEDANGTAISYHINILLLFLCCLSPCSITLFSILSSLLLVSRSQ